LNDIIKASASIYLSESSSSSSTKFESSNISFNTPFIPKFQYLLNNTWENIDNVLEIPAINL